MPLPATGTISMNDIHVEVGGTSGTQCSLNDADFRALIGQGTATQQAMSQYRGLSATSYAAFATWAASNYPTQSTGAYQTACRTTLTCSSMWGSPQYSDTTDDSTATTWALHSIQSLATKNSIANASQLVVFVRGGYKGYGAVSAATVHGCTSSSFDPWDGYGNDCYYYDASLNAYRKMTDGRHTFGNFTGP